NGQGFGLGDGLGQLGLLHVQGYLVPAGRAVAQDEPGEERGDRDHDQDLDQGKSAAGIEIHIMKLYQFSKIQEAEIAVDDSLAEEKYHAGGKRQERTERHGAFEIAQFQGDQDQAESGADHESQHKQKQDLRPAENQAQGESQLDVAETHAPAAGDSDKSREEQRRQNPGGEPAP